MTRGRALLDISLTDAGKVDERLGLMQRELLKIEQTAIKTLRRRLPVEARRDIQREYDINATRVRKDLTAKETPDGVRLLGQFRGIGLRNFKARQTRKGVSYAIFRGQRGVHPGAFLARLSGGNVQVVERSLLPKRVMTAGRYKGKVRTPIQTVYGPTVAQMLRKGRRPERLADFARGVIRDETIRLVNAIVDGKALPTLPGDTP